MDIDISTKTLVARKKTWEAKSILRKLYGRWYRTIDEALKPGIIVEIGGGSGHFKEFFPKAIVTDIVSVPWLDAVHDAHALPFKRECLDNLVLFDVLHHLTSPYRFFREAQRVLKKNGRIIVWEPCISFLSFFVYHFLHQEEVDWRVDPFRENVTRNDAPVSNGNLALSNLLFGKYRKTFQHLFPHLQIVCHKKTDFFEYPLSGGFHHPCLVPSALFSPIGRLEKRLSPFKEILAFRQFLVFEKAGQH